MINRYHGNSGRFTRIEETGRKEQSPPYQRPSAAQTSPDAGQRHEVRPHPMGQPSNWRGGIFEKLSKLIPGNGSQLSQLSQLETEDIILLLILYLMYRESGDSELLMIMGAMFLM